MGDGGFIFTSARVVCLNRQFLFCAAGNLVCFQNKDGMKTLIESCLVLNYTRNNGQRRRFQASASLFLSSKVDQRERAERAKPLCWPIISHPCRAHWFNLGSKKLTRRKEFRAGRRGCGWEPESEMGIYFWSSDVFMSWIERVFPCVFVGMCALWNILTVYWSLIFIRARAINSSLILSRYRVYIFCLGAKSQNSPVWPGNLPSVLYRGWTFLLPGTKTKYALSNKLRRARKSIELTEEKGWI